jgi:hypothetical protein
VLARSVASGRVNVKTEEEECCFRASESEDREGDGKRSAFEPSRPTIAALIRPKLKLSQLTPHAIIRAVNL